MLLASLSLYLLFLTKDGVQETKSATFITKFTDYLLPKQIF